MSTTHQKIEGYINIQKYEDAIILCNRFLESKHKDDSILYWRAVANCFLKHYKEAVCDFDEIIGRNPNYAELYSNRGSAKIYLGLYESAIEDLIRALELNPQLYESYIGRISALTQLGKFESAKADCDYLISKNQFLDLVYVHYAYIELKLKHFEEAIQKCNLAIRYNSQQIMAYLHRATIILSMPNQSKEQYHIAIEDCRKIIEIDPNCPFAYFNMGICYANIKEFELALECYYKALSNIETYENTSFIFHIETCDVYLRIAQLFPVGDDRSDLLKEAYNRVLDNWNRNESTKIFLYKYKSFGDNYKDDKNQIFRKIITDRTVWFSDFIKLNDPRDGYIIQQIEGMPTELDLKGFRELSFALQTGYTDVNEEETMWGYYADGGNGICLVYELDLSKLFGKPYAFSQVDYVERTLYQNNTFSTKDFINARLFTKTPLWKNEHEARIVTYDKEYLEHSLGVSILAESIGLKLIKIRFGCRCDNDKVLFIKELANANDKVDIEFSKIIHEGDPLGNGEFKEIDLLAAQNMANNNNI